MSGFDIWTLSFHFWQRFRQVALRSSDTQPFFKDSYCFILVIQLIALMENRWFTAWIRRSLRFLELLVVFVVATRGVASDDAKSQFGSHQKVYSEELKNHHLSCNLDLSPSRWSQVPWSSSSLVFFRHSQPDCEDSVTSGWTFQTRVCQYINSQKICFYFDGGVKFSLLVFRFSLDPISYKQSHETIQQVNISICTAGPQSRNSVAFNTMIHFYNFHVI